MFSHTFYQKPSNFLYHSQYISTDFITLGYSCIFIVFVFCILYQNQLLTNLYTGGCQSASCLFCRPSPKRPFLHCALSAIYVGLSCTFSPLCVSLSYFPPLCVQAMWASHVHSSIFPPAHRSLNTLVAKHFCSSFLKQTKIWGNTDSGERTFPSSSFPFPQILAGSNRIVKLWSWTIGYLN